MAENINDWMLKAIRDETNAGLMTSGWLEEDRFKWTNIVSNALHHILEGTSFILITDQPREWFKHYITHNINHPQKNRPFIPIISINHLPALVGTQLGDNASLIKDMLDLAFKKYSFFYIGKRDNAMAELAISNENSFLWLMDENLSTAFSLNTQNTMLDFRLLQLYKIFDRSLSAYITGKIILDN